MNGVRIRENLPLKTVYVWPDPPWRPKEPRSAKFERRQRELDGDKRKWFNAMVWGMQTPGKK